MNKNDQYLCYGSGADGLFEASVPWKYKQDGDDDEHAGLCGSINVLY